MPAEAEHISNHHLERSQFIHMLQLHMISAWLQQGLFYTFSPETMGSLPLWSQGMLRGYFTPATQFVTIFAPQLYIAECSSILCSLPGEQVSPSRGSASPSLQKGLTTTWLPLPSSPWPSCSSSLCLQVTWFTGARVVWYIYVQRYLQYT